MYLLQQDAPGIKYRVHAARNSLPPQTRIEAFIGKTVDLKLVKPKCYYLTIRRETHRASLSSVIGLAPQPCARISQTSRGSMR